MSDTNVEMIQSCPKDGTILDIGANHGAYSVTMADYARKVYAFEPDPKNAEMLREVVKYYENIWVHEIALSNFCGTAKLMLHSGNPGGHSIHPSLAGERFTHTLENSIDVEVLTLDKWCRYNGVTRVDGIKIDVEAHEKEVLEGAKETLKSYHPLIALETHHFGDMENCKKILEECGYSVSEMVVDRTYLLRPI